MVAVRNRKLAMQRVVNEDSELRRGLLPRDADGSLRGEGGRVAVQSDYLSFRIRT